MRDIPPGTVSNVVCYLRVLTEDRPHCRHRRSCPCLVGTTLGTLQARATRSSGSAVGYSHWVTRFWYSMRSMLASGGLTRGTPSTNKEHSEYSQGHFEYHAGTEESHGHSDGTLSTHTDTVNDRIKYSEYFHAVLQVPALRGVLWTPACIALSSRMGLAVSIWGSRWHVQRTNTPHSHVRARKARAHARVRMSVHCEPLPSRSDASLVDFTLAPHCAALGFEFAAARFEYCAGSAPSEAASLQCARGTDRCMVSSASWLRGSCMLRSLRKS
jgi:hypothetical protein